MLGYFWFKIYVNDLVSDINRLNARVTIQDGSISMVIVADDIVLNSTY